MRELAVLISGGLDSAILLGESLRSHAAVHPLYVRFGLFWEDTELAYLCRFLEALAGPALRPLQILDCPVRDLYDVHWSVTGAGVPADDSPDDAVFLPGRNVFFLAKALVWCHLRGVPAVALGSLQTNPFADATPAFFKDFANLVNQAVGGAVQVQLPYRGLRKTAVMQRGRDMPLQHTFSCMRPVKGLHCGGCNKCGERKLAFADAGMPDPTEYANSAAC